MKLAMTPMQFILKLLQGALIGLGAVLPGISGGVLCVVFGVYTVLMEFLANPFKNFKTHIARLLPILLGVVIGFLGVANILSFFLDRFPSQSVCLFIGLIGGMLPSLFEEAGQKGRGKSSYIALIVALVLTFALLISLRVFSVQIAPNFLWYLFCGFCLALSIIAPGMSFSTLLMPLGLYEPFVAGIGHMDFGVLIPGGIGAILTIILFAKAVNMLFDKHYSPSFHAILGVVIAATVIIIPFESFTGIGISIVNIVCIVVGVIAALELDKFNKKHAVD
ncbi:MAG: DUF368 domain-containing protein [Clostridia bacterium]|nr:DUF368 domain-containing protein [Clostridia bacterium]